MALLGIFLRSILNNIREDIDFQGFRNVGDILLAITFDIKKSKKLRRKENCSLTQVNFTT